MSDHQPNRRPPGATDAQVAASGAMSEALETLERARGHLYSFHQLMGHTDLKLDEVKERLVEAGEHELAATVGRDLVGRNVVPGYWTFQLIERFDEDYWEVFRAHEKAVRDRVAGGRRHVHEAEMKERRRTHGREGHDATPE